MLDNAIILKKPQYPILPKIRLYTWPHVFTLKLRDADKPEPSLCILIAGEVSKRFPFPEIFALDDKALKNGQVELVISKCVYIKPPRDPYPTFVYHKNNKNQQNEMILDEIPSGLEFSSFEVDPNSIVFQDVIRSKKRIALSIQCIVAEKPKFINVGYLRASRSQSGKAQVLFHLLFPRFYKINQISSIVELVITFRES